MTSPPESAGEAADAITQNIETIVRLEQAAQRRRTFANRLSDGIADFTGTIWFVLLHLLWFGVWAGVNVGLIRIVPAFDPYPFQLLCMIVSLEGVLLSTFVLIKQNRMGYLSDRREHLDLQINMLAEREVTRVLQMVEEIAKRLNVPMEGSARELVQDTPVEGVVQQLEEKLGREE
jgi:uncharacterized membrane protein